MPRLSDYHYTTRATIAQVVATVIFNTLQINVGFIVSAPAIVIGALALRPDTLTLTPEQQSWFGSLIFIAQPLGSFASGFLQDWLGRKRCMMLINVPQVAAWLLMRYASTVDHLFIGVAILGLTMGFMEAPVLSYIGETVEPRLRGPASTSGGIFYNIGFFMQTALGAFLPWRTMLAFSAVTPVVAFAALYFVPESPVWLVSKGRKEEARQAFCWLRGWVPPQAVQQEVDDLIGYVTRTSRNYRTIRAAGAEADEAGPESFPSRLKVFLMASVQRPLWLIIAYFFVTVCASLSGVKPFIIPLLKDMGTPIDPFKADMYGSVLSLLGAITASLVLPRVGKRPLTFASLSACTASCLGLALLLALRLPHPWLILVLLGINYYCAFFGIIVIPWILISELFPLRHNSNFGKGIWLHICGFISMLQSFFFLIAWGKGLASGVAAGVGYIIIFLSAKSYHWLVSLATVWGALVVYGVVGLAGLVFLFFCLPETEGVPLEQAEALLTGSPVDNPEKRN